MGGDDRWVASRSLLLQLGAGGLLAATSFSRPQRRLDLAALPVLLAFAEPSTVGEARARIEEEWEIEEPLFQATVDAMVASGILVAASPAERALAETGFADVLQHLRMLRDSQRVCGYREAIGRHAAGRHVVEIGCGSGILSLFAARAGARRVTAIEETAIAELAAALFAANGVADRVDLRRGNSRDVELDPPGDLLVHEIIGVDPLGEDILPSIADARARLLVPGGRMIPDRLELWCVGVEAADLPLEDRAALLEEARDVGLRYGFDPQPLADAIAALPSRALARPFELNREPPPPVRILSDECPLCAIDLTSDFAGLDEQLARARLRIRAAGTLGGLLVFFRARLDEQSTITNSPVVPPTSWHRDLRVVSRLQRVAPGDEVALEARIETAAGRQRIHLDVA